MQLRTRFRSLLILIIPAVLLGFFARLMTGNLIAGAAVTVFVFSFVFVTRLRASKRVIEAFGGHENRELEAKLAPLLVKLSNRARIPAPKVLFYPDPSPNLAAVGALMRGATILVSEGLLSAIDEEGLESLLAHAICRIKEPGLSNATFAAALGLLFTGVKERGAQTEHALKLFRRILTMTFAGIIVRILVDPKGVTSADKSVSALVRSRSVYEVSLARLRALIAHVNVINDAPPLRHLYVISPPLRELVTDFFDVVPSVDERIERVAGRAKP